MIKKQLLFLILLTVLLSSCTLADQLRGAPEEIHSGDTLSIPVDVSYFPTRTEILLWKPTDNSQISTAVGYQQGITRFCGTTEEVCVETTINLLPGLYIAEVDDKTTRYAGIIGKKTFRVI
jgi:hypothetical protein